jgi:hypothetical protein
MNQPPRRLRKLGPGQESPHGPLRAFPEKPVRGLHDGVDDAVWTAASDRKIGPNIVIGQLT